MKANFTIILVYKSGLVALSNMPAEKEVGECIVVILKSHIFKLCLKYADLSGQSCLQMYLGDNLSETRFEKSVKMSTYLVAFVVCDFKSVEGTTDRNVKVSTWLNIKIYNHKPGNFCPRLRILNYFMNLLQIRVWAPEDQKKYAHLALDSAKVILNYYEKYFGVEYPLPKQGWWLIVEIQQSCLLKRNIVVWNGKFPIPYLTTRRTTASTVQKLTLSLAKFVFML